MGIKILSFVLLVLVGASCTQGHCRRKQDAPGEAKPLETPAEAAASAKSGTPDARPTDRVMVYKYDGSLQCGGGKPISKDVMQKELNGVQVYSSVKKADGLMHIQVCGSNTGMANVYEIPAKDLKKAEAKGFKKWAFE